MFHARCRNDADFLNPPHQGGGLIVHTAYVGATQRREAFFSTAGARPVNCGGAQISHRPGDFMRNLGPLRLAAIW
jgi:hypothetical protein